MGHLEFIIYIKCDDVLLLGGTTMPDTLRIGNNEFGVVETVRILKRKRNPSTGVITEESITEIQRPINIHESLALGELTIQHLMDDGWKEVSPGKAVKEIELDRREFKK